jgi:hypothetical protein
MKTTKQNWENLALDMARQGANWAMSAAAAKKNYMAMKPSEIGLFSYRDHEFANWLSRRHAARAIFYVLRQNSHPADWPTILDNARLACRVNRGDTL